MYTPPISNLSDSLSSLDTALSFCLKEEERLWRMAEEAYDAGSSPTEQSERYKAICDAWRPQVEACETIAKVIQSLNPEYTDERFNMGYRSNQIVSLKRYTQRKAEKLLSFPYNK